MLDTEGSLLPRSFFMNRFFHVTAVGLAVLAAIGPAMAASSAEHRAPLVPQPRYAEIARAFAFNFPRAHLSRVPLDDAVSARSWTNYFDTLDYESLYLLAEDEARFVDQLAELDNQLRAGDLRFAYDVFKVFKARVHDRCDYVRQVAAQGLDFTKDESYTWKRRDEPRAAGRAEWDELWRLRVKNDFIREMVSREAITDTNDTEEVSIAEAIAQRYDRFRSVLDDYDAEWVLQQYLSAVARAFDPHSSYMSPGSLENFNIEMKLSLVGIGALLSSEDGAAKIERLIPGGPAARDRRECRLVPGDKIVAVAQGSDPAVDVRHWPLYKTVKLIRGARGTPVVLTVISAADPTGATTRKVDLIRDEVKLEERAAVGRIEEIRDFRGKPRKIGIVSLPAFYADMHARSSGETDYRSAADDVQDILQDMQQKGVEGILLDLRNNGGGSLPEAEKMVGHFIGSGPTVQVKERYRVTIKTDKTPGAICEGPVVVLVNRLSASAAEIFAGALQDYGRAVIVGDTKTHGKGTVQTIVPVRGDDQRLGAMKVTIASYYRITGASTQIRGVFADIVIRSPMDLMELGEDFLPNALSLSAVDPAPYTPVAGLDQVLAILREKSELRRSEDPRFQQYRAMLERVRKTQQTREALLNIEKRRELAATEEELAAIRESFSGNTQPSTENDKIDLVLEEAAHILADFVVIQRNGPAVADTAADASSEREAVPALVILLVAAAATIMLAARMKRRRRQ